MLPIFLGTLIALGAAVYMKGREMRGLIVLLSVSLTEEAYLALHHAWGWFTFASFSCLLCVLAIALVKRSE